VNPLTMWLTLATFVGYAIIYTVVLKPMTPQNIVIGGASGAMPPVLGWAAATGDVPFQALLLFLIIFAWTPPHFWALAIARRADYANAGIPMLPVAYGVEFTQLHILLYTILLFIVTLLPYLTGMSGLLYLAVAVVLGVIFTRHAVRLRRADAPQQLPMQVFRYSINYLMLLFAALLIDHYLRVRI
ncbi:MAG: heme o synthase, partial [Steroidobacteraceae bacterium]